MMFIIGIGSTWAFVPPKYLNSGMPQHWQTSLCGEPNRVLIDTLNRFESCFSVSVFGTVSPFSQRETAWRVTKTFSASSSRSSP